MSSILDKLLAEKANNKSLIKANANQTNVIDNHKFFIENNNHGYISKPRFLEYINSLSAEDLMQLQNICQFITDDKPLNCDLVPRPDKLGNDRCYYILFGTYQRGSKLKLILWDSLDQFFKDHFNKTVTFKLDLEGLLQEAKA